MASSEFAVSLASAVRIAAFSLLAVVGSGCAKKDEPSLPRMRPLTTRSFERTAARIERGRYLAEGVCQCFLCHSERDWSSPGAPVIPVTKGGGRIISEDSLRRVVAPNISPDRETGAGTWTDDMLARAIREGIGHDDRALAMPMWFWAFANLSDEDVASVVVYLRTIPAVRNPLPKRRLSAEAEEDALDDPKPITEPVPDRDMRDSVERGRYLADIADCAGCHTAWEAPFIPGLYGGGNILEEKGKRLERDLLSANITRDPSGIAYYSDSLFIEAIRTGAVRARTLDGTMPWTVFRNMNDKDLLALYAYLRAQRPVRHIIDNQLDPTPCLMCGQGHGEGAYNLSKLESFERLEIDTTILDEFSGSYEGEIYTVAFKRKAHSLLGISDGVSMEFTAAADTLFYACELPGPISFRRDATGRVVEMVAYEDKEYVSKKVR